MSGPTVRTVAASARATVLSQVAVAVYGGLAVIHLTSSLLGWERGAGLTMGLLMPPLAVYLATVLAVAPRSAAGAPAERRIVATLLVALGFCWLGDLAGDIVVKLAAFGLGHVAYCVAWWPARSASLVGRRRTRVAAVGAYAVVAVTMVAVLAGHVGGLIGPIAVYAVLVSSMAVLASVTGPRGALGGVLFVVSDTLLGWHVFVAPLPLGDVWVMASYLAAQWLVVTSSRTWLLRRRATALDAP